MSGIIERAYERAAQVQAMAQDIRPEKRAEHARFFPVYQEGIPSKRQVYRIGDDLYECLLEGCTAGPGTKSYAWRKIDQDATDMDLI